MSTHAQNHDSNPGPRPLLLTREELAERYSVTPRTIADWQSTGFFPHVKLAKKCVRFPVAKCDAIVERLTRGGNGGANA